jgi:hypothetical protein
MASAGAGLSRIKETCVIAPIYGDAVAMFATPRQHAPCKSRLADTESQHEIRMSS